jgi:hypothetical protein
MLRYIEWNFSSNAERLVAILLGITILGMFV